MSFVYIQYGALCCAVDVIYRMRHVVHDLNGYMAISGTRRLIIGHFQRKVFRDTVPGNSRCMEQLIGVCRHACPTVVCHDRQVAIRPVDH